MNGCNLDRRTTRPSVCPGDDDRLDLRRRSTGEVVDVLPHPARRYGRASRPAIHRKRPQPAPALVSYRRADDCDLDSEKPLRPHPGWVARLRGDGDAERRISVAALRGRHLQTARAVAVRCQASADGDRPQLPLVGDTPTSGFRVGPRTCCLPEVHRQETGTPRNDERVRRQVHFRVRTSAVSQVR